MDDAPDWGAVFDSIADEYDQAGVAFFKPIAQGLLEALAPRPGDRVLEYGAGRGALTLPLAHAVGETGQVDSVDISARMVELLAQQMQALPQVRVRVGDASTRVGDSYDAVAASLVLFFLPDPVAALAGWRDQLAPTGKVGVATFQPWRDAWRHIDHRLREVSEVPVLPDEGPFASDEGVAELFTAAGFTEIATHTVTHLIRFENAHQWCAHSAASAYGAMLSRLSPEALASFLAEVDAVLATEDGLLPVDIRYTVARP